MVRHVTVRLDQARQDKDSMPKKRPPKEIWQTLRQIVWERDGGQCVRCRVPVTFEQFHCDHIRSGKLGNNSLKNLRSLCKRCHILRADHRHQGMIAKALAEGIIPPNWRE